MNIDLSKMVVVITGASRGIGRALAIAFAKEQAFVVVNYNSSCNEAEELKKEINVYNKNCLFVQADITRKEDVSRLYTETMQRFGRVDVLINNAGVCDDNLIQFMSENQWQKVIDTNLTGAFLCSRTFSKAMIHQKKGKIINISSIKGQEGSPGQVNYSASKAGLIGFSKALAKELGCFNVSVNTICPGFIVTDLNRHNIKKRTIAEKKSTLQIYSALDATINFALLLSWTGIEGISGRVFNLDSRIL
ncbi:SDR family NAD(P)-dependent oxidoreductase [bacterium]|nr:SDR family NAD(P)-dependent oxidoreductase [bacterium]